MADSPADRDVKVASDELQRANEELRKANAALRAEIQERRLAEERLRASEQSYRSLWDSLTDLVYILDLEGRFLTVNDAVLERYGMGYDEIIGRTPEIFAEASSPDVEEAARRFALAVQGEPQRFDFWARTKSGEAFPKELVLTRGEYFGAPVVIGVGRDVTERWAAEAALRDSEERFRSVVESLGEGLLITAADERIVYANPRIREIFGYEPEELVGRIASEMLVPEDARESFLRRIERRRRGAAEAYEVEQLRKDGSRIWTEVHGSTLFDTAGRQVGTVGAIADITERKRAEAERAAAEEHYRRLVMHAPHGIFVIDADGRMTEVNPAGALIMGRPPGDLLGEHFSDLIAEHELPRAVEAFVALITGAREDLQIEVAIDRPTGDRRLLDLILTGIREGGAVVGIHGTARDITDEHRKDRQLRRVERLASLGTLIGGVAHELNNPLQAIRNFSELLLLENQDADHGEGLEIIRRESERAARLVSDLRLVARQTQEVDAERRAVDLNEIAEHVVKVRGYALETRNVDVRLDRAAGLPAVTANRAEIEQVLINLLVNAEQAMEESEGARLLTIRTAAVAGGAIVEVTDTGAGIARQDQERIFDPFFTTKPPGEGTGLGLSLAHSIVTEHGGEIHVDSEPGAGTTVRVRLPWAGPGAGAGASAVPDDGAGDRDAPGPSVGDGADVPSAEPGCRPLRILIVDDEYAIRRVVIRFLGRLGHTVEGAADGGAALRLIDRADYDVILSDLRMPGVDGETLFHRLREAGGGMERRVVFMTGDAASPDAARVLAQAGVPVLVKPVPLEELERVVRDVAGEMDGKPAL